MVLEKLPPFDAEAEEAVIASCLVDPSAIWKVASILRPGDFFREQNKWIYEAILSVIADGSVANQITIAHELARANKLEQVGGTAYLSQLIGDLPTPLVAEHCARLVLRDAQYRQLITAAQQIAQMAYRATETEPQVVGGQGIQLIQEIVARGAKRRTGLEALDDYLARQPNTIRGLHLSFPSLERAVPGLEPGEVMIVAALTSVGKTAFVLNIAHNLAILQHKRVAFFSVEMNLDAMTERFLSLISQVSQEKIQRVSFNESEQGRVNLAAGLYAEALRDHLLLVDAAAWEVGQVMTDAHNLHAQKPLDLIIVDYLGALRTEGKPESRVQEVSHISRSLKGLARDLNVPLIAVSQLSRQANERDMPKLSDLKDSGSLEQDAGVVAFLHWVDRRLQLAIRSIKVSIAKNRNGPLDEQDFLFDARTGKFTDPKEAR